ncbi:hypothetical protein NSP_1640 [Nodularia spumigena CCY9414]|nr:hypothetical protein NSP_1640 [Nodularia spumigena CCY9414]
MNELCLQSNFITEMLREGTVAAVGLILLLRCFTPVSKVSEFFLLPAF